MFYIDGLTIADTEIKMVLSISPSQVPNHYVLWHDASSLLQLLPTTTSYTICYDLDVLASRRSRHLLRCFQFWSRRLLRSKPNYLWKFRYQRLTCRRRRSIFLHALGCRHSPSPSSATIAWTGTNTFGSLFRFAHGIYIDTITDA